jgi:hypothetical protein
MSLVFLTHREDVGISNEVLDGSFSRQGLILFPAQQICFAPANSAVSGATTIFTISNAEDSDEGG